jgi:hypothetical protein
MCDAHWIYSRWHHDERERSDRLWHGFSHVLLRRGGWDHHESDAVLLTGELAMATPLALLCTSTERGLDIQPHATRELIQMQLHHAWNRLGLLALPG